MKSDWYKTKQSGTYLVVKAGSSKALALADSRLLGLIAGCDEIPFVRNLDSYSIAEVISVFGINDCLKLRGYCIVRSSVLLEDLGSVRLGPAHDHDAVRGSESR
jgi:hypothetical protein